MWQVHTRVDKTYCPNVLYVSQLLAQAVSFSRVQDIQPACLNVDQSI